MVGDSRSSLWTCMFMVMASKSVCTRYHTVADCPIPHALSIISGVAKLLQPVTQANPKSVNTWRSMAEEQTSLTAQVSLRSVILKVLVALKRQGVTNNASRQSNWAKYFIFINIVPAHIDTKYLF